MSEDVLAMQGLSADAAEWGQAAPLSAGAAAWAPSPPPAPARPRLANTEVQLYVRNLHHKVTSDDLRNLFAKYCDVEDVAIPLVHETQAPRGFAFVTIKPSGDKARDAESGEAARLALHGTVLRKRRLRVDSAQFGRHAPAPKKEGIAANVALNEELVAAHMTSDDVLELFVAKGTSFNQINLATALHRLGVLVTGPAVDAKGRRR
ncbi:hypothetical protein M885DRAFT_109572 [Pelagophyceae sp. CCMP2097]|nr:hypothetical protein M885DRAFT_109572 [Pelagophyceae sp. CCMP2097]